MTNRILDFSEKAVRLSVRLDNLRIRQDEEPEVMIPLADIAVAVVSHPQVTYTQAVLAGLAAAGGAFVACDERHLPVAMLLPIEAHYVQAERFVRQAQASVPTQKRLWKQIVRAKLRAQARVLNELYSMDAGIPALISRVRSGDPANVEAQASRRYWPKLFNNPNFRRRREGEDLNRHLNYGYAVLRAMVARAVCAVGLHPSLGLHHHNRYNAFCLADDLMEPFRPLVDGAVARMAREEGGLVPLDRETKQELIEALTGRHTIEGESRTLFDILGRTASSLAAVYLEGEREISLPEI